MWTLTKPSLVKLSSALVSAGAVLEQEQSSVLQMAALGRAREPGAAAEVPRWCWKDRDRDREKDRDRTSHCLSLGG